jgi:hypothetical protein
VVGKTTPAPTTVVGTTPPSARQATHLDFTNEDDEGSETDLTPPYGFDKGRLPAKPKLWLQYLKTIHIVQ